MGLTLLQCWLYLVVWNGNCNLSKVHLSFPNSGSADEQPPVTSATWNRPASQVKFADLPRHQMQVQGPQVTLTSNQVRDSLYPLSCYNLLEWLRELREVPYFH